MSKQTYTTGQVLTSAQMTQLQTNDYNQTVSAKVASYTLVASDAGTRITMANASATTITVNTNLFTAGDTLTITNISTGVCTITAGTATVSTSSTLALKQYDSGELYFTSTGVAIFFSSDAADSTSPLTTKGDIYGFSTLDARIPIGTNNQVLTADSAQALGLKWATPDAGGKVLQVVYGSTSTSATNATATYADTNLTATITPTLNTSKVMVLIIQQGVAKNSDNQSGSIAMKLMRGATSLGVFIDGDLYNNTAQWSALHCSINYLDSPATTSATTYKTQFLANAGTVIVQRSSICISTILLLEIGA